MRGQAFQIVVSPFAAVVGVGVATAFASSSAFADVVRHATLSSSVQSDAQDLNSALFLTPPAKETEPKSLLSVGAVLNRAFQHDDLKNLYNSGGFAACETSSRVPSFFEKNYSNFAASCYEDFKSRQAVRFDERFRDNPAAQGVVVSPLGGRVQWSSISTSAKQRALQRSFLDFADSNKVLATFARGSISFQFGISSFFKENKSANLQAESNIYPRYEVVVLDSSSEGSHAQKSNRPLVASVGRLPQGSLQKDIPWFAEKPVRKKRILREVFPAPVVQEKTADVVDENGETTADTQELSSLLRSVSRLAGLNDIPFSKVDVRTERRVVENRSAIALRASESQDLFFAEFPDLRRPSPSTLVWGYKVPYKNHAISVRKDENIQEKITSYSYKIDDSNKSEFNYNHKSKAVSAGFVISF